MPYAMNQDIQSDIRKRVLDSGAQPVARSLSVNPQTLTSYLAGIAQPGSVLMIEKQYVEVFGKGGVSG